MGTEDELSESNSSRITAQKGSNGRSQKVYWHSELISDILLTIRLTLTRKKI